MNAPNCNVPPVSPIPPTGRMFSFFYRRLGVLLFVGALLPVAVFAQDPDTTEQQLPDIAPREFEIRGQLQVSFPALERQPLQGFASPPSVPSVPADHTPYLGTYKQDLAELPESLPEPDAVSASFERPEAARTGFVEFGGGRYTSRFAEAHLSLPVSTDQTVSLDGNYNGMAGFSPYPSPSSGIETPSDDADGRIQFESRHDAVTVRAAAHAAGSAYTLYGEPQIAQRSDPEVPDRSGLSGGLEAAVQTRGSVRSRVDAAVSRAAYDTDLGTTSETFREQRLALDGRLSVPLGATSAHLDLSAARSTYGGDVPDGSGFGIDGGFAATLIDTDAVRVRGGGRILTFEAPATPQRPRPGTVEANFIVPQARAELALTPSTTLFGENRPGLDHRGLESLYQRNPYAEHAPSVQPTLFTTDAASGVRVSTGPLNLSAEAGYRYAPNYQFFSRPTSTPGTLADPGLAVQYGSARILHGGVEMALQGRSPIEASLRLSVRDGELVGPEAPIPYFSPVVAEGMFSVSFADQKGLVQTTGTIESPRPVDVSGTPEVDTYVSFDVEASYEITTLLSAVLELRNVGPAAPERWARYARPPAVVSGGFQIHW